MHPQLLTTLKERFSPDRRESFNRPVGGGGGYCGASTSAEEEDSPCPPGSISVPDPSTPTSAGRPDVWTMRDASALQQSPQGNTAAGSVISQTRRMCSTHPSHQLQALLLPGVERTRIGPGHRRSRPLFKNESKQIETRFARECHG